MGVIRSVVLIAALALPAWAWPAIPRACDQYQFYVIATAAQIFGRNAPAATLGAQLRAESNCDSQAVSYAGAIGLAQFTEGTSIAMGRMYPELRPVNRRDPAWSIMAQARLVRDLLRTHADAFDTCERWAMAMASYNQSEQRTKRGQSMVADPRFWFGSVEFVNPGKSQANYEQTFDYVRKILLRFEPEFITARWGRGACN